MDQDPEQFLANLEQTVQATLAMPDDQAHEALMELIDRLAGAPGAERDPRIADGLGYCWYNLPGEGERRSGEIEKWFGRALALDPGRQTARLYLGHHLFARQRYDEARQILQEIPAGTFEALGQPWWALKIRELIACCGIYQDPNFFDTAQVKDVCRGYAAAAEASTAVPTDLVEALMWALGRTVEPMTKNFVADAAIFLMDKMGLRDELIKAARQQPPAEPDR